MIPTIKATTKSGVRMRVVQILNNPNPCKTDVFCVGSSSIYITRKTKLYESSTPPEIPLPHIFKKSLNCMGRLRSCKTFIH